MSESSNLIGGKVTYLDGRIANQGNRTVTGITVQVLFRDPAHEVAQNETQPLKIIRTRDPYIDVEPLSAAPLKPGEGRGLPADLRHGGAGLGWRLPGDPDHSRRYEVDDSKWLGRVWLPLQSRKCAVVQNLRGDRSGSGAEVACCASYFSGKLAIFFN